MGKPRVGVRADANTAYVSFDGHRSDNRATWLFRTTDGGKTWTNLSGGLAPNQPVYVIEEDSRNPDLLFAGTEFGLQASLDRGRTWRPFMNGLPTVAVYDIVIHPRDRDVILGTHGRGIYVLDESPRSKSGSRPYRRSRASVHAAPGDDLGGHEPQRPTRRQHVCRAESTFRAAGQFPAAGPHAPDRHAANHLLHGSQGKRQRNLEITSPDGHTRTLQIPAEPGITRYAWDGRMETPAAPGGGRRGGAVAGAAVGEGLAAAEAAPHPILRRATIRSS